MDNDLELRQFDVKAAFPFAPLEEDIYILTPKESSRSSKFLKLKKSLYGLLKAPSNWHKTLTMWLESIGLVQSSADLCLYIHTSRQLSVFFNVDDLVVAGEVEWFEKEFLVRFPRSSAHTPDVILGMEYMQKGIQLVPASHKEQVEFQKLGINFRTFTGLLNYVACRTRTDISAAASILSQFNQSPGISHWKELLHVWKYLAGTINYSILLNPSVNNPLRVYTDATWADNPHTQPLQTG